MLGYVVGRLGWAVALFFAITLVTFVIFFVLPQPQVRAPGQGGREEVDIRSSLRLHGPVLSQYRQFVSNLVLHGWLGRSYFNRRPVTQIIRDTAPVTLALVVGGAIVWILLALPIGIVSALRPRSLIDRAGMIFILIGVSAHPAWLSLILAYGFGFRLGAFPLSGYCDLIGPKTDCGGPTQWVYHMILPWFAIAFLFAALYARMIRASVLETIEEDYVRTARAKGAGSWRVIKGHVLRNSMLPVVTMVGMDIGYFLTQAIFVESVFGLPGVGRLLRASITQRDLPVILGIVMFTTIVILVLNLVVDLLYKALDPRIQTRERMGAEARRARGRDARPLAVGSAAPSS